VVKTKNLKGTKDKADENRFKIRGLLGSPENNTR
jgi:hypothetical protein